MGFVDPVPGRILYIISPGDGAEVYSIMRESNLAPDEY
ncbi:unnamed protein product, partial [marine sediment metagenome]